MSKVILCYQRMCGCKCGATTGRPMISTRVTNGQLFIEMRKYPGPVCDGCEKPWEQVSIEETSNSNQLKDSIS